MAKTPGVIVTEIKAHAGSSYSTWYAGIAADARDRMFVAHKVDEQNGGWIIRTAGTNADARTAETALHTAGFEGGRGGGDSATKQVYAYKITNTTVE